MECFLNDLVCTTDDNGGVHSNSGVINRLFAVMADGGIYRLPSNESLTVSIDF